MTQTHNRLSYVDSVKTIQVIEVVSIRGLGTTESPIEQITEYFKSDGTRLARVGVNDNPGEIHNWIKTWCKTCASILLIEDSALEGLPPLTVSLANFEASRHERFHPTHDIYVMEHSVPKQQD